MANSNSLSVKNASLKHEFALANASSICSISQNQRNSITDMAGLYNSASVQILFCLSACNAYAVYVFGFLNDVQRAAFDFIVYPAYIGADYSHNDQHDAVEEQAYG